MIVYADVLVLINFYIDYLLLLGTEKLCRIRARFRRRLLGAAFSALCSLTVLWQDAPLLLPYVIRVCVACLTVLMSYGRSKPWTFARRALCYLTSTYAFAGFVLALQMWLHPNGVMVRDGVVYWDVSAWLLLGSTTLCYGMLCLLRRLIRPAEDKNNCLVIDVTVGSRTKRLHALYDTGNMLFEPISGDPVVVVDRTCAEQLIGRDAMRRLLNGNWSPDDGLHGRMVPYQSVGASGVMPAFRPDRAKLNEVVLPRMYLAVSPTPVRDGYDGIVGPEVIEEGVDRVCLCR